MLFRVLHALSLYFPAMGYVQGMASLAATLLCYYDEETAFVMLIRMFELRGLEKLYQAGFGGLMSALEEFENGWIRGGAVSRKLVSAKLLLLGGGDSFWGAGKTLDGMMGASGITPEWCFVGCFVACQYPNIQISK